MSLFAIDRHPDLVGVFAHSCRTIVDACTDAVSFMAPGHDIGIYQNISHALDSFGKLKFLPKL